MSLFLMYGKFPVWHVFTTIWSFTDLCFSVQFVVYRIERDVMLLMNAVLDVSRSFDIKNFHLRPLNAISSTFFLVTLFSTCSLTWRICFFLHRSWNEWKHVWSTLWDIQVAFSIVIPISVVDFFQELYDLWQMFRSGIPHVPFDFFDLVFRIFCNVKNCLFIFVNISLICLYLSSLSSFIFTMDEFIPCNCVPTESEILSRHKATKGKQTAHPRQKRKRHKSLVIRQDTEWYIMDTNHRELTVDKAKDECSNHTQRQSRNCGVPPSICIPPWAGGPPTVPTALPQQTMLIRQRAAPPMQVNHSVVFPSSSSFQTFVFFVLSSMLPFFF